MLNFSANVDFRLRQHVPTALQAAQFALDNEVMKNSNYYIPKDTGNLEASALTYSRLGEGHVGWNTPYARKLYYNPSINFSKDKNPNAQALWFEAAKARRTQDWLEKTKQAFFQYFLNR